MSRDIPSDLYHMVNAAYCDAYATCDTGQVKYAPTILTRTRFMFYNGEESLANWLAATARK